MSPKVSEEYLEERRNHILDAAVTSFSRNGLHQTTIEDIRMEADVSKGAVYHYFKTKEDIVDAIRQRSAEQAEDVFEETLKGEDVIAKITNLINVSFKVVSSPDAKEANRLALFLWAESIVNPRLLQGQLDAYKPYLELFTNHFRDVQKNGNLNPELDPEALARVVTGTMLGLLIQTTWEPGLTLDKAHEVMLSIIQGDFWQGKPK